MPKSKSQPAPAASVTPERIRVHALNADLVRAELVAAVNAVADVFVADGEYAQLNLRAARVGGKVTLVATSRGEHGGDSALTRRGVENDSAFNVAGYDYTVLKGAEVSARKNDRNKSVVSEAMARLGLLEKWIANNKSGKRPCAKLTGKHYAVCVAENNPHAARVKAVVDALA